MVVRHGSFFGDVHAYELVLQPHWQLVPRETAAILVFRALHGPRYCKEPASGHLTIAFGAYCCDHHTCVVADVVYSRARAWSVYLSKEARAYKLTEHAVYDRVVPDVLVDDVFDLQRSAVLAYENQRCMSSNTDLGW